LAYFKQEDQSLPEEMGFQPGDLVEFDVREEDDLRLALDPCLVSAQQYGSLAGDLIRATSQSSPPATKTSLPGQESDRSGILPFPIRGGRRPEAGSEYAKSSASDRKFG
jgi:hypothetical protein